MTWPAPDLRIDYQNATVSADTHPAAHNDTNVTLNDDYRPEINRLGAYDSLQDARIDALEYPDFVAVRAGNAESCSYTFRSSSGELSPGLGMFGHVGNQWVRFATSGVQRLIVKDSEVRVNYDLTVEGTINGTLAFGTAEGIETQDVLDRAETAAMPVIDDGVARTDADVESLSVNEVVTALLLKVKELSARIETLEGQT